MLLNCRCMIRDVRGIGLRTAAQDIWVFNELVGAMWQSLDASYFDR